MRKLVLISLLILLPACGLSSVVGSGPTATVAATSQSSQSSPASSASWVPGSSQKVCQLVGETDKQLNQPAPNQTETRYGLVGNDLGYSFEHDGKLFFLFGDSDPTPLFNGKPNGPKDPPRTPDDNDAIAYSTDTSPNPCVRLTFITSTSGAYQNPVVLGADGKPAITLRTNEVPIAGIDDGGKMYVIFATDNPVYPPGPTKGNLGRSTRTVVASSDDDGQTFHYLYDFSKGPDAHFIDTAIAAAADGYLYFWGAQGGDNYRKSAAYLARKPVGSMGTLDPIQYLKAVNADGSPVFSASESDAMPLFHDTDGSTQADCMGEHGVEYNSYIKQWMMLYNCQDETTANLHGVYMRLAAQPWGPWSSPQTIFSPARDGGLCSFIHRAVTAQNPTPCDRLSGQARQDEQGGDYGPYFLSRMTTGDASAGTTTFYYTLSTWNPYVEVIMKSTVKVGP